jgi:hypothetical protein
LLILWGAVSYSLMVVPFGVTVGFVVGLLLRVNLLFRLSQIDDTSG